MNKYVRILGDCPCLRLYRGTVLVRHVITGMDDVERSVITSYYGLNNSSEVKSIDEIAEEISSNNTIITTADVVKALNSATSKLHQEFDDFDGKVESVKIKWIPFRTKTERALVEHGLHYVGDIIELEKKAPLQSIKGIGVKGALEVYEILSLWYEPLSFTHYRRVAKEWREKYDPYVALLKDMYGKKDKYIIPNFVRDNINKAIEDMAKANISNLRLALAIRKHFGLDSGYPMSYEQLGEVYLLVSRTRAQQIVNKAVRLLRRSNFSEKFEFVTYSKKKLLENYSRVFGAKEYARASSRSREELLENYFRVFEEEERERASFIESEKALTKARILAWDSCPLDELELSVQTYNKLRQNGLDTIGDIAKLGRSGLKEINGFKRSNRIQEVEDKLATILPSNNPFWKEYYK